jgi:hypothetical protein
MNEAAFVHCNLWQLLRSEEHCGVLEPQQEGDQNRCETGHRLLLFILTHPEVRVNLLR